MVTDFKLGDKEGVLITDLIKALREHTKDLAEEYDFSLSPTLKYDFPDMRLPLDFWQLIAYAVEGGSEGYYIHAGCLIRFSKDGDDKTPYQRYLDFGFAKTYSVDSAYKIAREAQRFLTAARWN